MKILWLSLHSSWAHSSLALPLIHTACRTLSSWEWTACTGTVKEDPAAIACSISKQQPDLVCASLYIFNLPYVLDILARIKAMLPHVCIAVGGPECLGRGARELVRKYDCIDYACQGEGEAILPFLLDNLEKRITSPIPGVVTRQDMAVPIPQVYKTWEEAPLPCLDPFFDFTKPFVQIETSRGCPNHCSFCTSAKTAVRYRPLESVRQELTILHQRGIREIRLLDRTFNLPSDRAVALLKMFRNDFSDMHFHLEFNPCFLPLELKTELQKARPGQLHIEAGMQSMHKEVLDAIGRSHTCQRAVDGLEFLCSLSSIVVHSDLISGLPEQSLESLYEDIQRMSALGPGEIQLEVLKILKGTALEHDAEHLGLIYSPHVPYDVMCTPWMNAEEIVESRFLSRIIDLFYNAVPLQTAFRKCLTHPPFLQDFLTFSRKKGLDLGPGPALKKRFLWLHEFLQQKNNAESSAEAIDDLKIAWMKENFGPVDICADARSVTQNELGLCLYSSVPESIFANHETRFLQIVCSNGRKLIFVYHRASALHKAVAIFQGISVPRIEK